MLTAKPQRSPCVEALSGGLVRTVTGSRSPRWPAPVHHSGASPCAAGAARGCCPERRTGPGPPGRTGPRSPRSRRPPRRARHPGKVSDDGESRGFAAHESEALTAVDLPHRGIEQGPRHLVQVNAWAGPRGGLLSPRVLLSVNPLNPWCCTRPRIAPCFHAVRRSR